jgi:hypothetical protein
LKDIFDLLEWSLDSYFFCVCSVLGLLVFISYLHSECSIVLHLLFLVYIVQSCP